MADGKEEAFTWTDDRVQMLMKLWNDGRSASQIAAELGGVTRNAVIGKVHRLGLSGRAKSPSSSAPRVRKARPTTSTSPRSSGGATRGNTALKRDLSPAPAVAPDVDLEPLENVVPIGQRCTLVELKENTCRWPLGDPGKPDFVFCGGFSEVGVPYCAYHCRIAYQPVADRRRRAAR